MENNEKAMAVLGAQQNAPAIEGSLPISQIKELAAAFAESGLFNIRDKNAMFALMMISHAEGIHPAIAALQYDIVQGRPAMKAAAMAARFRHRGGKIEVIERTDKACELKITHPNGDTAQLRWTIEMAANAGLTSKSTWKAYPRAMLFSRCLSELLRDECVGVYTPEEVEDFEPVEKKKNRKNAKSEEVVDVEAVEINDLDNDPTLSNDSVFEIEDGQSCKKVEEQPQEKQRPTQQQQQQRNTPAPAVRKNQPSMQQKKALFAALTRAGYDDDVKKHKALQEKFGATSFRDLTADQVSAWIDELNGPRENDPFNNVEIESAIRAQKARKIADLCVNASARSFLLQFMRDNNLLDRGTIICEVDGKSVRKFSFEKLTINELDTIISAIERETKEDRL